MSTFTTIITVLSYCACLPGASRRDLSETEARSLVVVAVGKEIADLPHFGLDRYEDPEAVGFFVFEATADHPGGGSPVVGQFAVNKATGDVWRLGFCEKVHSSALYQAEAKVRKKIKITQQQLRRLASAAPCQP